jgi:hypothetical protein
MHNTTKQHNGAFIRKIGGWGKYYEYLKSQNTIQRSAPKIGRNSIVTIKKGDAVNVLKYKKAQKYLNQGWTLDK